MEKKRSRYWRTVEAKVEILGYAREHGIHQAAIHFDCAPKSIRDWMKNEESLRSAKDKAKRRSLHKGPLPKYEEIEGDLYQWIISKRAQNKPIITAVILSHMRANYPQVTGKSDRALSKFLSRFMKRHMLVYRKPTHQGQALPANFEEKINEFRNDIAEVVSDKKIDPDRLVNMDETPIYFAPSIPRVLSPKGAKTVTVETPKCGYNRLTLILAVASDGSKLPPLLVFKGEYGKKLHKMLQKNLIIMSKRVYACCDKKAWNSSTIMNFWLDNVWNSFSRNMKANALIMDDYSVHKTSAVKSKLNGLRTLPCYIPGGLTSFLQPLDVGVNHIVKQEYRSKFSSMMVEHEEEISPKNKADMLIKWIDEIWSGPDSKITAEKIKNCFAKAGLIYAPEQAEASGIEEQKKSSVQAEEEEKGGISPRSQDYNELIQDLAQSDKEGIPSSEDEGKNEAEEEKSGEEEKSSEERLLGSAGLESEAEPEVKQELRREAEEGREEQEESEAESSEEKEEGKPAMGEFAEEPMSDV